MAVAVVDVRVDSSSAVRNLQQVAASSSQAGSAAQQLTNAVNKTGREIKAAANGMQYYIDATGRARKENGQFVSSAEAASAGLQRQAAAARNAGSAGGGLAAVMGRLLVAFSAIEAAKFVFAKTAELETQTRSLQTLTGSAQQAKQIIAELQQLGAVTPFTSTELIDAAKRLQAFGVEAKNVVETTRRLADVSGATGAELQGLVTAYGQVQAKGRLQGEELLQFQERGIALQGELRKMYGMTGDEFQKALSKGQISAQAVEVAIVRLTEKGGKYANGAIAQSDTLAGKFSTLTDGIEQLARTIGQVLEPALKRVLGIAIDTLNNINAALSAGRMGDFRREIALTKTTLGAGAAYQGIDRIAYGISQVSSQKNKAGIEQNLQMLREYQALLSGIRADQVPDPTYQQRLLGLQGQVFKKISENLAAQKQLQTAPRPQASTTPPPLLTPTGSSGSAKESGAKAKAAAQEQARVAQLIRDRLAEAQIVRLRSEMQDKITNAEVSGDKMLAARLKGQERELDIQYRYAQQLAQEKDIRAQQALIYLGNTELVASQRDTQRELNELQRQGDQDRLNSLQKLIEKQYELNTGVQNQLQFANGVADAIGQGMGSAFSALISGAQSWEKSLQQIASGVLVDIANQLIKIFVIEQAVNAIKTFLTPFSPSTPIGAGGGMVGKYGTLGPNYGIPQRAQGGSVTAGQPYLVGERGPELFMPGRSGGIAPTGSFGGGAVNVTVNVTTGGSSVQGDQAQGKQLGLAISAAVQSELIKQKRPGGLLA